MSIKRLAVALLTVSGLALAQAAPALAQNVRVLNADSASTLRVPMNRAVVVETEQPFAELSIANPGIADISTLSDRSIYDLAINTGRWDAEATLDLALAAIDGYDVESDEGAFDTPDFEI